MLMKNANYQTLLNLGSDAFIKLIIILHYLYFSNVLYQISEKNVTNAVLPGMRKRNFGRIITLSSVVGPLPDPYQPAQRKNTCRYVASCKNLDKNMRRDLFQ